MRDGGSIFVSSTFLDMDHERDRLVRRVFPALRNEFDLPSGRLVEIDLRWGITRDEAESGRILPICFDAIDQSRPWFICFLGNRYGWIDPDAEARLEWLREDLLGYADRSVTELEIRHAALDPPRDAPQTRCLFLFRTERLSGELVAVTGEPGGSAAEPPGHAARLTQLKAEIRARFPSCTLEYDSLDAFEQHVATFVRDAVRSPATHSAIPSRTKMDEGLEEVRSDVDRHEQILQARVAGALARPRLQRRLVRSMRGMTPLVVSSRRLHGASTLLAQAIIAARQQGGTGIFYRDCEHGAGFSGWRGLLNEIASQWREVGDGDLIAEPTSLAGALVGLDRRRPSLIVLDNLDGLFGGADDIYLDWLPASMPGNVSLCISCRNAEITHALREKGWQVLQMPALGLFQRHAFLRAMLGQIRKNLPFRQRWRLAASSAATTPGGLRKAIDHLRRVARFETLDRHIDDVVEAADADALDLTVLDSVRRASSLDPRGLPLWMLGLLLLSRRGLSEAELRRAHALSSRPEPRPLDWASAVAEIRAVVIERDGLLDIGDARMRRRLTDFVWLDAAQPALAQQPATMRALLAQTFLDEPTARRIEERPWQLAAIGAWPELAAEIRDTKAFAAMWRRSPTELQTYCAGVLASDGSLRIAGLLPPWDGARDGTREDPTNLRARLALLIRFGDRASARDLAERMLSSSDNASIVWAARTALVRIDLATGDPSAAARHLAQAPEAQPDAQGQSHMEALALIGQTLLRLGSKVEAFTVFEQLEAAGKALHRDESVALALGAQGRLLLAIGDDQRAAVKFKQQSAIAAASADAIGVREASEGLADCAWKQGKTRQAFAELDTALSMAQRVSAWEDVVALSAMKADRLMALDNFDAAHAVLEEARAVAGRAKLSAAGIGVGLKQAELFVRIGRPAAAAELGRRLMSEADAAGLAEHVALARQFATGITTEYGTAT